MILTVTPNPCVDKTVFIDTLEVGTFMRSQKYGCVPGGKGNNVARAVHAMGRRATAMPIVGGHTGEHVIDMITHDDGVPCVPLRVASPTRTITTVLEESVHRQTAFFEPGSQVTEEEARGIDDTFAASLEGVQAVCFCGTVPDRRIEDLYARLIPIAKAAGALTILDSHGPEFARGLENAPRMVKPNVKETEELVGHPLETTADRLESLDFFHEKGVELAVMSLGAEGALVSGEDDRFSVVPPAIEEVNPFGSGDAFVAGFAIGLTEGMDLRETARLACAMGTANAMSWDIGHFSRDDVDKVARQVAFREV